MSLLISASSFLIMLHLIVYSVFVRFVVFPLMMYLLGYVSEWSLYAFINVLTSNHAIELKTVLVLLTPAILQWTGEH